MISMIYRSFLFILLSFIFASYLGKWFWISDILSNFRIPNIIASIIFLIIGLIVKDKVSAWLLLLVISVQIYTVYQSYNKQPQIISQPVISEDITLLQYNVHYLNKNNVEIVNYFLENQAEFDIIFLQEVTPELKSELLRIEKYFPYKIVINEKWFGRAFYSKLPILNYEVKFFDHKDIDRGLYPSKSKDLYFNPSIHYLTVKLKTKKYSIPLTIYGIHTSYPLIKELAKRRNYELHSIAQEINRDVVSKHKILVGDFNVDSYSYWYSLLENSTKLVSAKRGTGINNTWPSWLKINLLRISIDNALVSKNINVKERIIGKDLGSDHLPVILKLNLMK